MAYQSERALEVCHLLLLPGDVRNIIYDFVFDIHNGVHIDFDHGDRRIPKSLFALSTTCKQIRHECKDLPYWLNTFHFHAPVLEESEQLLRRTRNQHSSTPIVLPLPQVIQSHYRKRQMLLKSSGDLTSSRRELREKAQQFVTIAMRLPHIDQMVWRLEKVAAQPMISRLQQVHVHLGSQIRHPFIERFFTAWGQVVPSLVSLSKVAQLRVSFELRISKRLLVAYEFSVQDADRMLAEMDACVEANNFTLPELATLNGIRVRVWGVFFGTEGAKPPTPFRPEGEFECATGMYRSCGIAVLDRIAFGREVELRA